MKDISNFNTGSLLSKSIESNFKKAKEPVKGKAKFKKVMDEWKAGTLKTSEGKKVTDQKQAIAIAMSESGMSKANTTNMSLPELVDEHKKLVATLESSSHEDDKKEAKKQRKELKEYERALAKSILKAEGVKSYADMIIVNPQGRILLLQRNKLDAFGPGKWSLPGGTIEEGETSFSAAIREMIEETTICPSEDQPPIYLTEIDNGKGSTSCYYFMPLPYNEVVTIDQNEHENYVWADKETLLQCDCLLDLKERLMKILTAWFVS